MTKTVVEQVMKGKPCIPCYLFLLTLLVGIVYLYFERPALFDLILDTTARLLSNLLDLIFELLLNSTTFRIFGGIVLVVTGYLCLSKCFGFKPLEIFSTNLSPVLQITLFVAIALLLVYSLKIPIWPTPSPPNPPGPPFPQPPALVPTPIPLPREEEWPAIYVTAIP